MLIFCEGERTELEYLDALKRQPWVRDIAAVDLRVETGNGGSVPTTLVSLAADARRKALDEEGEIDEFWCVFDVEWPRSHPGLQGIDAATYMPLVRDAARRAEELDERHRRNGTAFPHENPSSGMHRLFATIEHRRAP
ncbi:MAG: RloB family protein [Acidimicrobiales bacterium]